MKGKHTEVVPNRKAARKAETLPVGKAPAMELVAAKNEPKLPGDRFVPKKDVAKAFGVSVSTVDRDRKKGLYMPWYKVGTQWMVIEREMLEAMAALRVDPAKDSTEAPGKRWQHLPAARAASLAKKLRCAKTSRVPASKVVEDEQEKNSK
ncbi:MAG: hypothetical protein SGJ27_26790 [Candidatus Melainabacteria bacterium]|nr:hypothetical protein [Candidatus Melainabacteria bacterium]